MTSIQLGKWPGMKSRDSQGHLQTIREQTARADAIAVFLQLILHYIRSLDKSGGVDVLVEAMGIGVKAVSARCVPDCTLYLYFRLV